MHYYLEDVEKASSQKIKAKKEKPMNTKQVIYIGELPANCDQYELNQFILSQGNFNIDYIFVRKGKDNKSFAYVKFKSTLEAMNALKALNMKSFKDQIIKAEPFKSNDQTDKNKTTSNLFVKNLSLDITNKELYDLFSEFGNIISINLKKGKNGENLGYGYVNFEKEQSAKDAIENLNQKEFKGKNLLVSMFEPREKRLENNTEVSMLLIRNLSDNDNENSLSNIFEIYGEIRFCGIYIENTIERKKNGVVIFSKKEECESALNKLNKNFDISIIPIDNNIIEQVNKQKQESMKNKFQGCNLVVKNLPKEINEKDLLDMFKKYGEISSARIATMGVMKDKKNEKGEIIDKEFIYESKGYGFVLFKKEENAQKAKEELNDKESEFNGIKMKLLIENYDYNKGEKKQFEMIRHNMEGFGGNRNYNNINNRGHKNNNMRGRGRGNNRFMNNPQNRFDINNNNNNNNNNLNMNVNNNNNNNNIQNFINNNNLNLNNNVVNNNQNIGFENKRITVEGEHLVEQVKEKLKIENPDDMTEALGETLFYFLIKFIPEYNLNITNGRYDDTTICSRLTGILIKTNPENLLDIISKTDRLYHSLKEVLIQLMQTNRLDN